MPVLENTRHEKFAHEIAKGTSSREAYKLAGYEPKNDATADACASRLLSNAGITRRVAEIKEGISVVAIEKTAISKAWVIAKLVENVERAMQAEAVLDPQGNPTGEYKYNGNVANRALELIGKEQGMFVDRKEVGAPGDFDRLSDDELAQSIVEQTKELAELDPEFAREIAARKLKSTATKH